PLLGRSGRSGRVCSLSHSATKADRDFLKQSVILTNSVFYIRCFMPWESLKKSLSRKPLVLAGPMLRKVTPHSVTVWIAMQAPATVTLTVVDDQNTLVMTGELETVAIGLNLHIAAVTAHPLPGRSNLTEGVIYQYDLAFILENRSMRL